MALPGNSDLDEFDKYFAFKFEFFKMKLTDTTQLSLSQETIEELWRMMKARIHGNIFQGKGGMVASDEEK